MYYELYIDIFFAVNMMMDFLILFVVKKWLKLSGSLFRLALASMYGGAIVCFYILTPWRGKAFALLLFWIAACAGMIWIAFQGASMKSRWKAMLLFYALSIFFNGLFQRYLKNSNSFLRFGAIVILLILAAKGIFFLLNWLKRDEKLIFPVELYFHGNLIKLKGLWDTGNCLVSPFHQKGVSIISYEALTPYLNEETKRAIQWYLGERTEEKIEEKQEKWLDSQSFIHQEKIFVIPFHTIGKEHGMMPVLTADKLRLEKQGEWIEYQRALIGIAKEDLCSRKQYQMILSPKG